MHTDMTVLGMLECHLVEGRVSAIPFINQEEIMQICYNQYDQMLIS